MLVDVDDDGVDVAMGMMFVEFESRGIMLCA